MVVERHTECHACVRADDVCKCGSDGTASGYTYCLVSISAEGTAHVNDGDRAESTIVSVEL